MCLLYVLSQGWVRAYIFFTSLLSSETTVAQSRTTSLFLSWNHGIRRSSSRSCWCLHPIVYRTLEQSRNSHIQTTVFVRHIISFSIACSTWFESREYKRKSGSLLSSPTIGRHTIQSGYHQLHAHLRAREVDLTRHWTEWPQLRVPIARPLISSGQAVRLWVQAGFWGHSTADCALTSRSQPTALSPHHQLQTQNTHTHTCISFK